MNDDIEVKTEVDDSAPPSLDAGVERALDSAIADFEPVSEEQAKSGGKEDTESAAMVGMMYAGVFSVLALRLGDHWALSPLEVEALAVPTVAVIKKYIPNAKAGPEAVLLGAVAMVVLPRLVASKEPKTTEKDNQATTKAQPSATTEQQPQQPSNDGGFVESVQQGGANGG
jgi:hypothetical protein